MNRKNTKRKGFFIKIYTKNAEKITAELKKVEGRATCRTVSLLEIEQEVKIAEDRLNSLDIPKKHRPGCRSVIGCSDKFPKCYKYAAMATYVMIERFQAGWAVVKTERLDAKFYNDTPGIIFTEYQKIKITSDFLAKMR